MLMLCVRDLWVGVMREQLILLTSALKAVRLIRRSAESRPVMITKDFLSRLPQLWRNSSLPSSNWYTVSVTR